MRGNAAPALTVATISILALAAAASGGGQAVFVAGRPYGLGEQQVYAMHASATMVVRYRNADDQIVSKTLRVDQRRSVALTVEGYSSAGEAVLAVTTAAPSSSASPSASSASNTATPSPPPSPSIGAGGALTAGGQLADLSAFSMILSGLDNQPPELGKSWNAQGTLRLPLAILRVHFKNEANSSSGDENATVLVITSTGNADTSGKIKVPGFGKASLRGSSTATAASYVELNNRLVLGMLLSAGGSGNVITSSGRTASYQLSVTYAVKLMKLVAGASPPPGLGTGSPLPVYGTLATPNTSIFRPAPLSTIAYPAPVDTEYMATPAPALESPSPQPEVSLPAVPIPLPSDQLIASPPPAPSPTPS